MNKYRILSVFSWAPVQSNRCYKVVVSIFWLSTASCPAVCGMASVKKQAPFSIRPSIHTAIDTIQGSNRAMGFAFSPSYYTV